jgi:glycosyltransferase involved in cell wall biosynthesis
VCEGIPQKNLNYLAAGRPIVSFRASSDPSVDGETGIAVEDGDTTALAEALVRMLGDEELRRRTGAAGRELVEREMTWRAQGRRLAGRFREVIACRGREPLTSASS